MRKNDLIKMLESVKGNPHIYVWNGLVGDWMDFEKSLHEQLLVKQTKEFVRSAINCEHSRAGLPPVEDSEFLECYNKHYNQYDFPNEFVEDSEFERWYGKRHKKVYLLQPKKRGKNSWDRQGDCYY